MTEKKSLKEKIVHSVFIYETKKLTLESMGKIVILLLSLTIILVFGGVIFDIYTENGLGELVGNFARNGEYSILRFKELGVVFFNEIPRWVIISYLLGIALGCILLISIIKNWSAVVHKAQSLIKYWFSL